MPRVAAGRSGGGEQAAWGVLVLGDAPGFLSLVRSLPELSSRVVETSGAGAVAHTTFTGSCPSDGSLCVSAGTHNPHGGWTRAMIDYYIGGLADGFVSVLFSSFVGAVCDLAMASLGSQCNLLMSSLTDSSPPPCRAANLARTLRDLPESSP